MRENRTIPTRTTSGRAAPRCGWTMCRTDSPRPRAGRTTGLNVTKWLSSGLRADYFSPSVHEGPDSRVPTIDRIFPPGTIPGLIEQPDYFNTEVFVEANTREPRGNPRAGGRYRASYQRFADLDLNRYSFNRFELDGQQYISLFKNRRLIALRGLFSSSQPDSGNDVPFYLERTLGGPDDLRGFHQFRFRDRHLLLLQAEYRFEIFTAVDGALFYDTGKVASRTGGSRRHALRVRLGRRRPVRDHQRRLPSGRGRLRQQRRQAPGAEVGQCLLISCTA